MLFGRVWTSLVLRLLAAALLFYTGVIIGARQPNEKSNLAGQLSACSEIVKVFQNEELMNPMVRCVEFNGEASLGYPGHPEAPHFHLNGASF